MPGGLFSIGHSNHSLEHFLELLRQHQIEVIALESTGVVVDPVTNDLKRLHAMPLKQLPKSSGNALA